MFGHSCDHLQGGNNNNNNNTVAIIINPQLINYMSIRVLATLKKATSVAETCLWSPYNKPTFIQSSALDGIFKNIM